LRVVYGWAALRQLQAHAELEARCGELQRSASEALAAQQAGAAAAAATVEQLRDELRSSAERLHAAETHCAELQSAAAAAAAAEATGAQQQPAATQAVRAFRGLSSAVCDFSSSTYQSG
jgi:hypothetical protein